MPADQELLSSLNQGKLYELYVLSNLVGELANRGCGLQFSGNNIKFKAAPGKIKLNDPHFVVTCSNGTKLRLFTDIEFETFSSSSSRTKDLSARYELDLLLVSLPKTTPARIAPYFPSYNQVCIAVECKSSSNFQKNFVREALGICLELSPYFPYPFPNSIPEFWLAFIDNKGTKYMQGPAKFGIKLRHIEP